MTETLLLTSDQLATLKAHAIATYPEECCGLLFGTCDAASDRAQVYEVQPVNNDWTPAVNPFADDAQSTDGVSKRNRFWIEPQRLLTAQRACRDQGWIILGIYHSHPDHPAVPSERDRQLAWPGYVYPILSVEQKQVAEVISWRLNEQGQFYEVPMLVAKT